MGSMPHSNYWHPKLACYSWLGTLCRSLSYLINPIYETIVEGFSMLWFYYLRVLEGNFTSLCKLFGLVYCCFSLLQIKLNL